MIINNYPTICHNFPQFIYIFQLSFFMFAYDRCLVLKTTTHRLVFPYFLGFYNRFYSCESSFFTFLCPNNSLFSFLSWVFRF